MNKPHKWAEVIKAWADGKTVQCRWFPNTDWVDYPQEPKDNWVRVGDSRLQWQIKPELKTPGEVLREAWYAALKIEVPRSEVNFNQWQFAAIQLLRAYKAGELKDF